MMKTFLKIATLTLIIIACADSKTDEIITESNVCDCKELQHDPYYNVFHLGDRLKPFTGKCYDYYLGGKLKKDFALVEGKYDGQLYYYHKNGQLQSTAIYKEGLLMGDKKVYDDQGVLLFHGKYKRSRLIETVYNIHLSDSTNSH